MLVFNVGKLGLSDSEAREKYSGKYLDICWINTTTQKGCTVLLIFAILVESWTQVRINYTIQQSNNFQGTSHKGDVKFHQPATSSVWAMWSPSCTQFLIPLDYPGGLRFPDNWLMLVLGSNMAMTDVVQNTSPHLQHVQQKESLLLSGSTLKVILGGFQSI